MHLTVVGATGTTGRVLVAQALAAGQHVTVATRDAARAATVLGSHDRLRLVEGDPTDPAACVPAVQGADAVVVTLGAGRRGEVREAGTAAVVAAMHETGVRRLVCQSTIGVGSSRANLDLWWRVVMFGLLLRPAYADHVAQERVVEGSGLDWTIVRPGAFADRSPGPVHHGFAASPQGLRLRIGQDDLAAFLLAQLDDATYLHRAVSVSA